MAVVLLLVKGGAAYLFGSVGLPLNQSPAVRLTSPQDGTNFVACSRIALTAEANDSDGAIRKVEFFLGSTKVGEVVSPPYNFSWTSETTGNFTVLAKATDNLGATTWSAPVSFTVTVPMLADLRSPVMLTTNRFHFCLIGGAGKVFTIQTSSDLANWIPWLTVTNVTGVFPITDDGANGSYRFYRAVQQP